MPQTPTAQSTRAFDLHRRQVISGLMAAPLAFGCIGARVAFAEPLQDGTFRSDVIALLLRERSQLKPELHTDPGVIKIGSNEIGLANLYRHVRSLPPASRDQEILKFIDGILAPASHPHANFADVRERLRVQLVPAEYLTLNEKTKTPIVHRPLAQDVIIAYAIDEPNRYALVLEDELAKWEVTANKLHDQAVANLEATAKDIKVEVKATGPNKRFAAFANQDDYNAARCLCPVFMGRVHAALGPTLFLGIPNRDFLIAWPPEFHRKDGFAAQIAKDFNSENHPLSPDLLVSETGKLRPATKAEMASHGRG